NVEGTNFIFIKRNGLYFVCTSKFNVSPMYAVEILSRICSLCKDYCGVLNEDSIKRNFPLIYELLDEILDFGYLQATSTETLKAYVCNQPELVECADKSVWQCSGGTVYGTDKMSLPSSAANKPVIPHNTKFFQSQKKEIFVDLLEGLTVLIGSNGNILRTEIDGCIKMKSFLTGRPNVRIALNEDLTIGSKVMLPTVSSMGVQVDDCSFHESVDLNEFDSTKTLTVSPTDGEFTVMQYRISGELHSALPFNLITFVDEHEASMSMELILKLRCNIQQSSYVNNVVVRVPIPKSTESVSHSSCQAGQTGEYKQSEKIFYWNIRKIQGGAEVSTSIKINLKDKLKTARKEIGPVSLDFEIPMYICSGMKIRYLKVFDQGKSSNPLKWVRSLTHRYCNVVLSYLLEDVKRHANTNKKEETPSEEKPRASNNEPYMRHLYPSVNSNAPSTLGNMWTNWDPFLCPFSWMPYGGAAGAYTMPNTPSYQAQGYYGKDGLQYYLPHYAPVPPSAPYSYEDVCDGNRIATVAHGNHFLIVSQVVFWFFLTIYFISLSENTVVASGPVSLASQYTPSAVMMNNSLPPARDAVSTGNSFHGNTDVSKSGLHGNRILGNAFRLHEEAKKPIAAQTAEVSTTSNSRTASVRDWKSSEEPVDGLNQSNKTLNETKAEKLRGFDHDKGSIIQDYKKMKFMTMNGDKD
ncbi:hypothetical protein QZH41_017017, partial [Actinostola sp. cb2023]